MSNIFYINNDVNQFITESALDLDGSSVSRKIIELRQLNPNSDISNVQAWHRYFLDVDQGNIVKEFDPVIKSIEAKVDELLLDLESKNYFAYNSTNFKSKCFVAWASIYDNQTYAKLHNHWPWHLAAVYYPYVKNPSKIIFQVTKDKKVIDIEVTPKSNSLLIFQGHVLHKVETMNQHHDSRVVIAANLMLYSDKIIKQIQGK